MANTLTKNRHLTPPWRAMKHFHALPLDRCFSLTYDLMPRAHAQRERNMNMMGPRNCSFLFQD